jgi:hypothetical protein
MPATKGVISGAVAATGAPDQVGGFAYSAESPTQVLIEIGGQSITAGLPPGDHSLFFPATAKGTAIRVTPATPICVIGMVYGMPVPKR